MRRPRPRGSLTCSGVTASRGRGGTRRARRGAGRPSGAVEHTAVGRRHTIGGRISGRRACSRHAVGMVIAASVSFGIGGAFMKASDGFSRLVPSICLLVMFVIGAVFLTLAVRSRGCRWRTSLGLGIEVLVSVGLGRYLYGEQLTVPQVVGALLIVAGVARRPLRLSCQRASIECGRYGWRDDVRARRPARRPADPGRGRVPVAGGPGHRGIGGCGRRLIERRARIGAGAGRQPAGPHVHWRGDGEPRVLLVGHHDTVFPTARWRPGRSPSPTGGSPGRARST